MYSETYFGGGDGLIQNIITPVTQLYFRTVKKKFRGVQPPPVYDPDEMC